MNHATGRPRETLLTLHVRTIFRAISRVRQGVVIHGRKYHSAILIIIESGVIYCVALVRQNVLPREKRGTPLTFS